jgi:flavin reductase (DIM6/NTAB) family NADH-FMN oxidoreductase RutF
MLAQHVNDENGIRALRDAFSGFPCGIVAVAAIVEGEPLPLVASSFTVGVSQDPPLVMFAVQRSSSTWPLLRDAKRLGVSVLGETHRDVTRQLASKDKPSRFEGIDVDVDDQGAVFLGRSPVVLQCTLENEYPAGDHEIVVLRVTGLRFESNERPLVWHRSGFSTLAV